jgi:hypothetical protein
LVAGILPNRIYQQSRGFACREVDTFAMPQGHPFRTSAAFGDTYLLGNAAQSALAR